MITFLKNYTLYANKYKTHSEAVVIACYFNPQNSPYRLRAFKLFYKTIRHLNHRIVECVIGEASPQLPDSQDITHVCTPNLLWHKEALLNGLIRTLPPEFRYVFWLDADVIFENRNWLTEGVRQLKKYRLIQPFEYCVHLEKDQTRYESPIPLPEVHRQLQECLEKGIDPGPVRIWRSFCANHRTGLSAHPHYDIHGHVGFAWAASREVLEAAPLYDHALIGGGDHIIAHAGAGHLPHPCISKSFTSNIEQVNEWSRQFYGLVQGRLGFVPGTLLHIWHGDVEKRQYLNRIRDFTPHTRKISQKDRNGLYVTDDDSYVRNYFTSREVPPILPVVYDNLLDYVPDSPGGNSPEQNNQLSEGLILGGGTFGGGGAGGSWEGGETPPVAPDGSGENPPQTENNPPVEGALLEQMQTDSLPNIISGSETVFTESGNFS